MAVFLLEKASLYETTGINVKQLRYSKRSIKNLSNDNKNSLLWHSQSEELT